LYIKISHDQSSSKGLVVMSGVQVMHSSVRREQNISLSNEWQYTFFEAIPDVWSLSRLRHAPLPKATYQRALLKLFGHHSLAGAR
jgi:hypothetical protein